jgi:KaiC/GvpD/RAD55 family RecA-like ATPase
MNMAETQNGFPTGIKSFDAILKDSILRNSVTLLVSEVGAGANYWVYSSLVGLSRMKAIGKNGELTLPKKACYVSFSRTKEQVMEEVSSLRMPGVADLERDLEFIDLSDSFFSGSGVPRAWVGGGGNREHSPSAGGASLVDGLVKALDREAKGSVVVIDSMNDLIRSQDVGPEGWSRLVMLIKGISSMARARNNNVYVLLTANSLEKGREEDIADSCSSVFQFCWDMSNPGQPKSILQIKKFSGILPARAEGLMLTLETKISPERGFEVSYTREIMGK